MDYKNNLSKDKIYSIINGDQDYTTDFGKVLSDSFDFLFKDFGVQVLLCFFLIMIFFFLPFLLPFIMGGWYIYIHKKRHEGYATFSDVFLGFQHFSSLAIIVLIQVFIYVLLIAVVVSLGYGFDSMLGGINDEDAIGLLFVLGMLALLPFYYLMQVFFFFSTFFVLFSEMTTSEAISASFSIAKKKFWSIFLVIFVAGLIAGLGTNLCYIGLLLSYPFGFIASYIYFEQAFKIQVSEEDQDMDQILEHLV